MIIDCKTIHNQCLNELKTRMKEQFQREKYTLSIVEFGDNTTSAMYSKGIIQDCNYLGIKVCRIGLSNDVTQSECNEIVNSCNNFSDGILLHLPVPKEISIRGIIQRMNSYKDIDGFKDNSCFIPATARGIILLLEYLNTDFNGKNCVIVGRSKHIGRAVAKELLNRNCTTTICHSYTEDLNSHLGNADIIISATGIPGLIQKNNIKPGATLIDVGVAIEDGKVLGDVAPDCGDIANLTPVPGGMGLMTRIALLTNLLDGKEKLKEWG